MGEKEASAPSPSACCSRVGMPDASAPSAPAMVPAMLLRAKSSVRRCGVTETARMACSSGPVPPPPNKPAEVPHEGGDEQDGKALTYNEHDPGERHEAAQGHEGP